MTASEFIYTQVFKPSLIRKFVNKAILATLPKAVRVGPAVVCLNPRDPVVCGALTFRVYERQELKLVSRILREGMTVLDVGANVGLYTALAMHYVKRDGRILAFEPHPESYHFLTQTVAANVAMLPEHERPRVEMLDFAASASEGEARLYINPANKGDNRLYFFNSAQQSDALSIRTRTIDSALRDLKIKRIDFLKLDVQGHEFEVVQGACDILRTSPNAIILSEFWPDGVRQSCNHDSMDYLSLLADWNFKIYEVHRNKLWLLRDSVDFQSLISRLKGRRYASILGTKNLLSDTSI